MCAITMAPRRKRSAKEPNRNENESERERRGDRGGREEEEKVSHQ